MRYSDFQVQNQMLEDFYRRKMQSDYYQENGIESLKESVIALLDYTKIFSVHKREEYI